MNEAIIERVTSLPCFDNVTQIQALSGGITNINLCVSDGERKFVVRIGADIPEHGVMRWNELLLSQAAEASGISPAVHYYEPGILVLQFLNAETLTTASVRDSKNLPRIIELIKKAHQELFQHLSSPVLAFWPFHVNRCYINRLLDEQSDYSTQLPQMRADLADLEAATGPITLVVGHGDLLAANILDDGERLWLIDWEYGGLNTPLFDLAGLAGGSEFSEKQERAMLAQYFHTTSDVFWRAYHAMKCTSLMRETLWSMTSEIHSKLEFNYVEYTAENLARFKSALHDFRNL